MLRPTLALLMLATPALADRLEAVIACTLGEAPMQQLCTVDLTEGGAPVDGAAFLVTPTMPSMPMAHNIPPVEATATDRPGTYTVDLHLEMSGDWTLTLDVSRPRRDRIVLSHSFDEAPMHNETDHAGHGAPKH